MAANSKRERVLVHIVDKVNEIDWVRAVERRAPGDPGELAEIPATRLPMLAVLGQLPEPLRERKTAGGAKEFVSELDIIVNVYAREIATPDSVISSHVDDLWRVLMADRTQGGLVLDSTIRPQTIIETFPPFIACSLTLRATYAHGGDQHNQASGGGI